MHRLCTRAFFTLFLRVIVFVIINSHQSVQIPVNTFHIRRLVTLVSSCHRRCRELACNVRMYNGSMKNK